LGERASNLLGVLLSLTFFSVLLAVMLVAVSILPDDSGLAPPTLPGEAESGPVRTPQPGTLGEVALQPAPALVLPGAALGSITFTTGAIPPPTGTGARGGPPGVTEPNRGPGVGPDDGILRPGGAAPRVPGKARGHLKKKGESGHPKRGQGFVRCDEKSHPAKSRAKGRCDGPGNGNGSSGDGKGRGKGESSGGAIGGGGSSHGGHSNGNGLGLGHVKAKGKGHSKGHAKFGR
jgi:uncharacterized membrane protein YgcG